ncbi:carbohydrate ABC transporter permease [Microbacterium pseudoresistens]|uniref:Multiple sugar transport system permease protein n=1 Tax=Microbacterium pseudoresistens TaxID=640634 RepID=A0A7Y9ESK8_9MICO|nr:sugar ABC transporter permease [Microbacterium pseudoresistens]NYD53203.1 multiple sugar transport system permease protein [Microbacterium pseudoresistens]
MSTTATRAMLTPGTSSRRPRGGAKAHGGSRAEATTAWLFLAPFLLIFLVFTAIPAILALGTSMTDMTARDIRDPLGVNFTGIDGFLAIIGNPGFQRSFLNTVLFVVLCVPLSMGLGLALALMLNNGIRRLRTFFRAAAYVPVITNIVAAAVIWQYAFSISGPVNATLGDIGIQGPNWLGEPGWAVTTVVMMGVWRTTGTCMILFLAGLQAVPEEIYEAASTDGAGAWRRLWSITLPLLRPTTLLVTVLQTVSFLNIFEEPYLLTRGGPLSSTKSVALWVYEQFGFGNVSASMAGSVLLLLLVGIVAIVQFRMLRPKH